MLKNLFGDLLHVLSMPRIPLLRHLMLKDLFGDLFHVLSMSRIPLLVFFPHQMGEKVDSPQPELEKGVAMILYTIDHTAEVTTPSIQKSPTATNATEGPVASISQRNVATSQPSTASITSAAIASKSF